MIYVTLPGLPPARPQSRGPAASALPPVRWLRGDGAERWLGGGPVDDRPTLVALWGDAWGRELADAWWRVTAPLRGAGGAPWIDTVLRERAPSDADVFTPIVDAWFRDGMSPDRVEGLGRAALSFTEWSRRASLEADVRFVLAILADGRLTPLASHAPTAAAYQRVHRQLIAESVPMGHRAVARCELRGVAARCSPFLSSFR